MLSETVEPFYLPGQSPALCLSQSPTAARLGEGYVPAVEEVVLGLGTQSKARSPRPAAPGPQSQSSS